MTDQDYHSQWHKTGPLQIRLIQKDGVCKHSLGDLYLYEDPYRRPDNVCFALLHVLDLYVWRCALGFPSWESDNRQVYRVHCPSKRGTVWELTRTARNPA